jgi:hypothetical protein
MKVQRGDGQTQDIGFDSNGNLDTAAIKTFCDADTGGTPTNGTVYTWYDQSGNGNDATQSTAAYQPKIYDGSAVITAGGIPAVDPMGTSFMPTGKNYTQAFSSYVVCENQTTGAGYIHSGLNENGIVTARKQLTQCGIYSGTWLRDNSYTPADRSLFSTLFNGSSSSLHENGSLVVSGNAGTGNPTNMTLFARSATDGLSTNRVSEFIFYESDQSSNRTGIESDISTYYFGQDLLLDIYPSSEAAYSVRKLSKYYQGPCMKVRKDDGVDTGTDIGFDSDGNLDTDAIEAHCGTDNGYVVTWYDQSGNGNDATNNITTEQPQIYNGSAVLTKNSKPALRFDADKLSTSISFALSDTNSYFFVAAADDANYNNRVVQTGPSFRNTSILLDQGDLYASNFLRGGTVYDGQQTLISTHFTDNNMRVNVDGTVVATSSSLTKGATSSLDIGYHFAGGNLVGELQELLVYKPDQAVAGNVTGIESEINTYYSIYS